MGGNVGEAMGVAGQIEASLHGALLHPEAGHVALHLRQLTVSHLHLSAPPVRLRVRARGRSDGGIVSQVQGSLLLVRSPYLLMQAVHLLSHRLCDNTTVEILDTPTGFVMIEKQVIRDMIKQYPLTEYFNGVAAYQVNPGDRLFDVFQSV
jgi:hypothetical protein